MSKWALRASQHLLIATLLVSMGGHWALLQFAEAAASYANAGHFHFTDYYGGKIPPADRGATMRLTLARTGSKSSLQ